MNASSEKIVTVSNSLSLLRVVLAVPIIMALDRGNSDPQYNLIAIGWIALAGLTDLFDGWLARRLNQITELGKIIDPLADKLNTAIVLIFLAVTRPGFPVWLLITALVRDALIFAGGIYVRKRYGYMFTSNQRGKWTFGIMALTFGVYIVQDNFDWHGAFTILMGLTFMLLIGSFLVYTRRLIVFIRHPHPEAL